MFFLSCLFIPIAFDLVCNDLLLLIIGCILVVNGRFVFLIVQSRIEIVNMLLWIVI